MENYTIVHELSEVSWSKFVQDHPNGNIFQSFEMYSVYKNTKNYCPLLVAAINSKQVIVGILLSVVQKEHSGILGLFSSRSIIWGGPLIKNNDLEILDFVLKEFNKLIKNKAIYTQFRNMWEYSLAEKEIFTKNGFIFEDHLDIIHQLNLSDEQLFAQMHKGRRKNIRRAIRKGVIFEEINSQDELEESLELVKITYNRIRLPMPDDSFFISVYNKLYSQGYVKFFSAVFEEKIIAVRYVFTYNTLVYDWFAGTDGNSLDNYPNDFLPLKVMQWGRDNGFQFFQFGGAGKPNKPYGVRDYKLKFGGKLVNWGRLTKVNNSLLMKIGIICFNGYKILRNLIKYD